MVKLIVTHAQPDFDAVASVALAKLLHPDATAIVGGAISAPVATIVRLYRDELDLSDPIDVELEQVRELIVVDTADRRRIRPYDALLERVVATVYDHHPRPPEPIEAVHGLVERVGATASLLTRILQTHSIAIPAAVASLALLGIHEDTGHFNYGLTRPLDHASASHLLASGASVRLVRRYLQEGLGPDHLAFRARMFSEAHEREVGGWQVAVAAFVYPNYLANVSGMANELLEQSAADASVLAVGMDGKTLLFARSGGMFDVGAALVEQFGGGGHPGAAFARSELPPEAALESTLEALARHAEAVTRADHLMSRPVKTVDRETPIAAANAVLVRSGHNGLPVMDQGVLAGVVSRRDLERALRHELGEKPVADIMRSPAITASSKASLRDLETMVRTHAIGRIPIVEGGALVGIVTRSDLLAARHRQTVDPSPAARVLAQLPGAAKAALEVAIATSDAVGGTLFLVGGTVRDGLLGTGLKDLDLAIEGQAIDRFGAALQESLGGRLSCHLVFGTCTLELSNGLTLDVATTREEFYQRPGALPQVAATTLDKDLPRRDFTVNALAIRLTPEPLELIDPFGGLADLEARRLRSIHPLSFVEDPTRMIRGARLAGRLGFRFEETTRGQALAALRDDALHGVSAARLRNELASTLAEPRVAPALTILAELGALEAGYGVAFNEATVRRLDDLRQAGKAFPDRAYVLALLLGTEEAAANHHLQRFHWPRALARTLLKVREAIGSKLLQDEDLEELGELGRAVLEAASSRHAGRVKLFESAPARRKLRGRDVIDLGLPPGPQVGAVLREVARARADHRVATFDQELELARQLIGSTGSNVDQEKHGS